MMGFMADEAWRVIVAAVDWVLDDAWETQTAVSATLALAKRVSAEVGREPLIEDAKLLLAAQRDCTPSEAFELLVGVSKNHNVKVAELARRLVRSHSARS
ncbi:MAG: hypothetical protein QOJ13_1953 [Gaiellales bacterium]|jgi:AmiR/NasT family two-component response regulator|nr:hypothetical protein [Gaiellales bacterium]